MLASIVVSVLLWWVALTRWWRWRTSRSVLTLGTAVVFIFMALHTTVNVGAVDRLISEAVGVANATSAVKHGIFFGICLGASIIIVALRVPDVDRQRRWIAPLSAGATAATAVAVALFFSAEDAPQATDGYQFDELYVHLPGYADSAAFVMGVAAVLCTVITVVVLLGWDLGTPSGRGLAILACGVAVLASYAWIRGGYIVAARLGWVETSTYALDLTTQLALIGAVLTTFGLLWSSIEGVFRSQKQRRDFAELYMVVVKERWPGVIRGRGLRSIRPGVPRTGRMRCLMRCRCRPMWTSCPNMACRPLRSRSRDGCIQGNPEASGSMGCGPRLGSMR